jgi:site-specific recombinase XerD
MPRKIPDVLLEHEQDKLLDAFIPPARPKKNPAGGRPVDARVRLRDLCIVRLMLNAGLRSFEVLKLKLRDLEPTTGRLTVRQGKGKKDRVVWLGDADVTLVNEYLKIWPVTPAQALFLTLKGTPLHGRYVRAMLRKLSQAAGIDKNVHPHILRHTFATDLLRASKNLFLVQRALGHSNVQTTCIYLHLVDDELEDAFKNLRQ